MTLAINHKKQYSLEDSTELLIRLSSLTPSVQSFVFMSILLIIDDFIQLQTLILKIKMVQTLAINLLTSIDPS